MNVLFISNYFTHHQKPFSDAMYDATNGQYIFLATAKMTEERVKLGWGDVEIPSYVKEVNMTDKVALEKAIDLINTADVVIHGSLYSNLIKRRVKSRKLTFECTERPYKSLARYLKMPIYAYKCLVYRNMYLLCAGAYVAKDYSRTFGYLGKAYKSGYFPIDIRYKSIDAVINNKKKDTILWSGRFIDWKHPEIPVLIAKRLREDGYNFTLNIIGAGPFYDKIEQMININDLQNYVHILGVMSPENVRSYMERSEIFLFTSDRNEGWGAVLNESMNSGCAVVASHAIGSVPFMIQNYQNGIIYQNGDLEDIYAKVVWLLKNPTERSVMGASAYDSIVNTWNAKKSVANLIQLIHCLQSGENTPITEGPYSKAELLSDNWFKK